MSQHDSTPPPPGAGTPSSPYGGPRTGLSGRGTRFFDWMRGLGLVRTDGWIGGVCAGIAERLGIDPIIVRGIVVVTAILGAPALLIYAAAWALLPDRENRIHLQRLIDGDFQPAIVGIGAMALLSLLPMTQGVWWAGSGFWGQPSWGDAVGRVIWTVLVIGLVVGLVIAVTRGTWSRGGPAGAPGSAGAAGSANPYAAGAAGAAGSAGSAGESAMRTAATETAAAAGTATSAAASAASAVAAAGAAVAAADTVSLATTPAPALDTSSEPTEPPAPTTGATSQDVADWEARHAAWQAEHAQWKQRLTEDMRAVKAQRAAEMRARSEAMAADARARRRAYRAANPRAGAAFGWATVGVALIGAALASAFWPTMTGMAGYELTAGFAVATFVFGVASLAAGLSKRRSGFLTFLGILLTVITLVTALVPRGRQLIFDNAAIDFGGSATSSYAQPYGSTFVTLDSQMVGSRGTHTVDLEKGVGPTIAQIDPDMSLRVQAVLRGGTLSVFDEATGITVPYECSARQGDRCTLDLVVGDNQTDPDAVLRVTQIGDLTVQVANLDSQEDDQ